MKYGFKEMLLSRHDQNDTICVSAFDGKHVREFFCNGVDQAAALIERGYEHPVVAAVWTNIQRLKPGSTHRKKGEFEAYTNLVVDIDRRIKSRDKMDAEGKPVLDSRGKPEKEKINATDAEREVLRKVADEVNAFLAKYFGPGAFADSGNGFHLSWRCEPMDPKDGQELYSELLRMLRAKFEKPDVNMEIDLSLADETQVVTVWGTWNRKYPDEADRPQRQSELLYLPNQTPILKSAIMVAITENPSAEPAARAGGSISFHSELLGADPDWLEDYGFPDVIEFFGDFVEYESDSYDKDGDTHHPIKPCYAHNDGPRDHSTEHHCELIEFANGDIGLSCFSKDFGLPTWMAKLNELNGKKYPHKIFYEEPFDGVLEDVGVIPEDTGVASPVGELCYHQNNCQCGRVHVQYVKPPELFAGEFELASHNNTKMVGMLMSDIRSRKLNFLWDGRIPIGKGVVMQGPPGVAKSMAALSMIAIITTGRDWPDGAKNLMGPKKVILAATEDDPEDTIKPRLQAMGADVSRVVFLPRVIDGGQSRDMLLAKDKGLFTEVLKQHPDVVAVFLDPITGYFGGLDTNSNDDMRAILQKVAKLCKETQVNFIGIIHENKRGDAAAIDKILGAGALGQVFRVALRFSRDPENKGGYIMAPTKANLTEMAGGLRYTTESALVVLDDGTESKVGRIVWGDPHEMNSDDVMALAKKMAKDGDDVPDNMLEIAKRIIYDALKDGRRLQRDVHALLDQWERENNATIGPETRKKARQKIGAKGSQGQPWMWWLPGKQHEPGSREQETVDAETI